MREKNRVLFWVLLDRSARFAWSGRTTQFAVESMSCIVHEFDPSVVKKFRSKEEAIVAARGLAKRNLILQAIAARLA